MKKKVVIVGGGSAGLMCADLLDASRLDVHLYEATEKVGRKFLVAGKGGFNLTHSGSLQEIQSAYHPSGFMDRAIAQYPVSDFRSYLSEKGIRTFEGSSGKIFPVEPVKPFEVLEVIRNNIESKGVQIHLGEKWSGWNGDNLVFGAKTVAADYIIFALGGASWPKTGSNGDWLSHFEDKGVKTYSWQSSNAKMLTNWHPEFIQKHSGSPLKNIGVHVDDLIIPGEGLIDKLGIEGGAIYAANRPVRAELNVRNAASISIDLKPNTSQEDIITILRNRNKSITHTLRKELRLDQVKFDLLYYHLSKEEFTDLDQLAHFIKQFPLTITGLAPIEEAISSVGGVGVEALTHDFALKSMPHVYCIGEMVNWDTRTGGYLLQACYSMAHTCSTKIGLLTSEL